MIFSGKCQGCRETLDYVIAADPEIGDAPDVYSRDGGVAYRGGHLCGACAMRVANLFSSRRHDRIVSLAISLDMLPGVIRDSVCSVLLSHRYVLCRETDGSPHIPLDGDPLIELFEEIGRNAAMRVIASNAACDVCGGISQGHTCCPPERS